jgi:hypothetical protein
MPVRMKITRVAGPRGAGNRTPLEPTRSRIIAGLIALRKAGRLQGVWVDADVIRVREIAIGPPHVLTWHAAQALVESR